MFFLNQNHVYSNYVYFKGRHFHRQELSRFVFYHNLFVFGGHKLSWIKNFKTFLGHKCLQSEFYTSQCVTTIKGAHSKINVSLIF